MTAFEEARLAFVSKLSEDEKAILDSAAGPEDLLADIGSIDERHRENSILRRFMCKIEPFVRGIEQYAQVMDVYSNAKPEVMSVLWGSVRIILKLAEDFLDTYEKVSVLFCSSLDLELREPAQSGILSMTSIWLSAYNLRDSSQIFEDEPVIENLTENELTEPKIVDMLGRMGRNLGMLDTYSKLYPKSNHLYNSLLISYEAFFSFCVKCNDTLKEAHSNRSAWHKSSSLKILTKSLWKPVKREFESSIHKLDEALDSVKNEADLAEKEEAVQAREKALEQTKFESHRSLFEWLDPVDPNVNYQRALDLHETGTGEWIFSTPQYCEWHSTKRVILWLHAKPGAGKTIMASTVITKLKSEASKDDDMVLFYFCDYKEPKGQNARKLIQTLLAMICRQNTESLGLMASVSKKYTEYKSACSTPELFDLFLRCLPSRKRVYLVIDALDECNDRGDTIEMIRKIPSNFPGVSILLTSREEQDIKHYLRGISHLRLEPQSMAQDIETFVKNELRRLVNSKKLRIRQTSLERTIEDTLVSKANGMFQWVKCQFDVLCTCISDKRIQCCLDSVPRGLDETYIRIFERIRRQYPEDIETIKRIFSWLVHSFRPLKLTELAEAVHLEPDQQMMDFSAIPTEPNDLLGLIGGLVVLTGDDDIVGLAHYSIKEFLLSNRIKASSVCEFFQGDPLAHLSLATNCVGYLMMDDFGDGPCRSRKRLLSRVGRYQFLKYAATNWMMHYKALSELTTPDLDLELEKIFCGQRFIRRVQSMQQIEFGEGRGFFANPSSFNFDAVFQVLITSNPFYHAALYGLKGLILRLSEMEYDINERGGYYKYPLLAGAFGECASWAVIELMVDLGADIHVSWWQGNVAHANARLGNPQDWSLLRKLVQQKIDIRASFINSYPSILRTIAQHPSDNSSMVEYLLDHGGDMDERDWDGSPPLQEACFQGNFEVVNLLLNRGSRKNFGNCELGAPLQAAILGQHRRVVDLLLECHVDVNVAGGCQGSPLQAAAWKGDQDLVCHLLNNGAHVSIGGGRCGSPLGAAIDRGHWEIATMLLVRGADPNGISGSKGISSRPIHSAIYQDNIEMVVKLLGQGANLNDIQARCVAVSSYVHPNEVAHPLCHAIELNRKKIIDVLVAKGADTAIGNFCPFLVALSRNNVEKFRELAKSDTHSISNSILEDMLGQCKHNESANIVQDLIEKKFPDFKFEDPGLLLKKAIRYGSSSMLLWLLKHGVNPNTPLNSRKYADAEVETDYTEAEILNEYALPTTIQAGCYDLAEILLVNAADANLCNPFARTPLYEAFRQNNRDLMTKLLSFGARFEEPVWSSESCGKFAHIVASEGDVEMMDFISGNGVSITTLCDWCGSALSCAVNTENIDMIRYLVNKGFDINELNIYGLPLLKWAEDDFLDDACNELSRLGATKVTIQRNVDQQIEKSVSWLCRELSISDSSRIWLPGLPSFGWIMLGRCLLLGNDEENALIALEQTMRILETADHRYINCESCENPNLGRYHLCQNSTSKGICESRCLKYHEQELQIDGKLEDHAHIMYPRPFFSADIQEGYVALSETDQIPFETWLESLRGWKVKRPT